MIYVILVLCELNVRLPPARAGGLRRAAPAGGRPVQYNSAYYTITDYVVYVI